MFKLAFIDIFVNNKKCNANIEKLKNAHNYIKRTILSKYLKIYSKYKSEDNFVRLCQNNYIGR